MLQPNIKCKVCGGSEFTADTGFYFCLECNTQSQDVREEVYDEYFGAQKGTTRVLHKKAKELDQSVRLTSWEMLNYVLKGITEELISLGAKPELKMVTLQLWASYLRNLEVAFTSVEVERKPKLGYTFKQSDAEIIYGVTPKQLKGKSWTRSRSSSVGSSASSKSDSDKSAVSSTANSQPTRRSILKKLAVRKRALASAEYTTLSQETPQSMSQTLEQLDSASEGTETPKRMKITKYAKSLLTSSCTSSTDGDNRVRRRLLKHEGRSVRNVTTAKVVALVNIALAITQADILVADFVRWVEEGHISLGTARKFLPEDVKVDSCTLFWLEKDNLACLRSYNLITDMCRELGVQKLPLPDLGRLAERYCLELQLPDELLPLVKRLLVLISSEAKGVAAKKIKEHSRMESRSENLVMAAIVVVVKLLFSLDDTTEYSLSHTALQINRLSQEGEQKQLFVWSEWVQFVELRKAVVAGCHRPTRTAVYGETAGRDTELFLQHYKTTMAQLPQYHEVKSRYALKKEWQAAVVRCLRKLSQDCTLAESRSLSFPASLTPLHTCTQHLLTQHADLVQPVKHLLGKHFTKHSLDHVLNHNRTVAVGLTNDLDIVQHPRAAAAFQLENLNKEKESSVLPRLNINQVNFTVNVVESINEKKRKKHTPNVNQSLEQSPKEKFLSTLKEIVSDDSDEEDDAESQCDEAEPTQELTTCHTSLDLYNPSSQYWFCHINLSKNEISHEEFDIFAMKRFSASFLWFLKECSRMIRVPNKELYANVVDIEKNYKHMINEVHCLKRNRH